MTRAPGQGRHPLETMNGNIRTRGIGNEMGDQPLRKGMNLWIDVLELEFILIPL